MSSPLSKPELSSWKEISDYLDVNVRTAQKWEKTRGLPVRRFPGQKGRVVTTPEELERWKASVGARPRWWTDRRFLRWYSAGMTVVAAALLAWIVADRIARGRPGPPALFRAEHRTLLVMDAAGRELWRRTFNDPFEAGAYEGHAGLGRVAIADVDGDSRREVLLAYYSVKADTEGVPLYCFDNDGRTKWKFMPGRAIRDAGRAYPGPYIVTAFAVADLGGGRARAIAVASRHAVYYPSQFVLLDGRGKPAGEYWHSGHLDTVAFMDLDGDGVKEILLSGINNGYATAALAALDARDFTGASFQGPDSPYQIRGLPLHKERALILFPRTCLNRKFGSYNMAHEIFTAGGEVRVHVAENKDTGGPGEFAIYTFDRNLNCIRAEVSDSFKTVHRRLEAQGALDHTLSAAEVAALVRTVRRVPSPPVSPH